MMWPSSALLELSVRDLDVLDHAEDVRELQAHEANAFLIGSLEDLFSGHYVLPTSSAARNTTSFGDFATPNLQH